MKKLAILLIALLLIGALAACQSSNESPAEEEYEEARNTFVETPDNINEETPEEELDEPPIEPAGDLLEPDHAVLYDLPDLTLFNHDLSGSALFEHATLAFGVDAEASVRVLVFQDSEGWIGHGFVESWLGNIDIAYDVIPSDFMPGLAPAELLSAVIAEAFATAAEFTPSEFSNIRASSDGQTALFAALLGSQQQYDEIGIVIVQQLPGTDDMFTLNILLDFLFWEEEDDDALAELSTHIGLDLHALVAEWW